MIVYLLVTTTSILFFIRRMSCIFRYKINISKTRAGFYFIYTENLLTIQFHRLKITENFKKYSR